MNSAVRVVVLMYHYVRPSELRWSMRHNALDLEDFRHHLDVIQGLGRTVTGRTMSQIVDGDARGPNSGRYFWLTFDDGYRDCIDFVLPELRKRGLVASFFSPTRAVAERHLLEVNAIQYLLAVASSSAEVVDCIRRTWESQRLRSRLGETFEQAYARLAIPNDWNDSDSRFVKKILQRGLADADRDVVLGEVWDQFATLRPEELGATLYMTGSHLRQLEDAGMEIGSHGHSHQWLGDLSADDQRSEIQRSLVTLESFGLRETRQTFSYPFGSYNQATIEILQDLGIRFGLRNGGDEVAEIRRDRSNDLEVDRIDAMWFERFFGN